MFDGCNEEPQGVSDLRASELLLMTAEDCRPTMPSNNAVEQYCPIEIFRGEWVYSMDHWGITYLIGFWQPGAR